MTQLARAPEDVRILVGSLDLEPAAYRASIAGTPLDLPPSQFDLLVHLAHNRHRVVARAELARAAGLCGDRSVDVALTGLRRLLPSGAVRNVRNRGWILELAAFGG